MEPLLITKVELQGASLNFQFLTTGLQMFPKQAIKPYRGRNLSDSRGGRR